MEAFFQGNSSGLYYRVNARALDVQNGPAFRQEFAALGSVQPSDGVLIGSNGCDKLAREIMAQRFHDGSAR